MPINSQEISRLFSKVAPRYDLINSIISMGQDKLWRRKLVNFANIPSGAKILDVCSGSAEIAIEFAKKNSTFEIFAVDFSPEMLEIAKEKITKLKMSLPAINDGEVHSCEALPADSISAGRRRIEKRIKLINADALNLPFGKDYFDIVSIGFGFRNLADRTKAIREMASALKSGGKLLILEFSPHKRGVTGKIYHFYIKNILPAIAFMLGANPDAYRYLSSSIESFISPEEILRYLELAGFRNIHHKKMIFGVVYCYSAEKL